MLDASHDKLHWQTLQGHVGDRFCTAKMSMVVAQTDKITSVSKTHNLPSAIRKKPIESDHTLLDLVNADLCIAFVINMLIPVQVPDTNLGQTSIRRRRCGVRSE